MPLPLIAEIGYSTSDFMTCKSMKIYIFFALTALLSGCFQAYDDGDDLRTVPVTNNPNVVPNYGPIPGMGGSAPY